MKRFVFTFVCFVIASAVSYFAQPYAAGNSDLILVVTTVFTVFAGFLVAIITVLGDPSLVPGDSWRSVESRRDNIEQHILWHSYLFLAYLITIALIFVSVLVHKVPCEIISDGAKVWIDRGYLFFGVFSFLMSFALPFSLREIQMRRLDEETEQRRRKAGIKD
jgi:hypothetical protein